MPTREQARAWFPSLSSGFAYLENAGGSQVPGCVAKAVSDYMTTAYVQLGAGYPQSVTATRIVDDAHAFIETFMNAGSVGKVVLGPSTTALTNILAHAYAAVLQPGDEVIIAETNHEANAGPWARLERLGVTVKWWKVDPTTFECPVSALPRLLTDRTKIVAMPHVSNLLGGIADVRAVAALVHACGARLVVDGVAYAPHRAIDVQALGADWYVYSTYKVYGPHMAALYGSHGAFAELEGPNHFFVGKEEVPYKWELGGVSHEGCAGLLALSGYLAFLADRDVCDRPAVEAAFATMEDWERPLQDRLLRGLHSRPEIRIIGPGRSDSDCVGTVSFLHDSLSPAEVVAHVDRAAIGIRYGHMYAWRLCESLGIDPISGVVRVSLVHYNTDEEIDRLLEVLP